MTKIEALSLSSSYVENVLKHTFLADLLQTAWRIDHTRKINVFDAEVDDSGFDLVVSSGHTFRHIQLKSTHSAGRARSLSAHTALSSALGGCIVWLFYSAETLRIEHYRFFGEQSGGAMADISGLPKTKTVRRDIHGQRREREHHRKIKLSAFSPPLSIEQLYECLFGNEP